ncbi:MAG: ribonucleoside-diphosphate reductase subunit alpha [Alphaproteobacteria bacterium]|nr:ribonucleoside-diphosphate reductase subunit alpha [Alphaproteobacteria bacterium]
MLNRKIKFRNFTHLNDLLTDFGKTVLKDRYLLPGESLQDAFRRVAFYYSDSPEHGERLYKYISHLWFMPATPVLSNGGSSRGLPISCFLNEATDSLRGILDLWEENVWLASRGGGIGSYWGNLRSIGENIKHGKTSGIIPFIKVMDSLTLAISQGNLRRGSAAIYLPIDHPEIEEFIEIRKPTGGDLTRKALHVHHAVVISDAFMEAVRNNEQWALISPFTREAMRNVSARSLWIRLLTCRLETGEPYLLFIDHVNKNIPEHHKELGLDVKMSNLCSEITLPTGIDHLGNQRTAVCCLSSVNLEHYDEWCNDPLFIEDCIRFLDNVLDDFIKKAPSEMSKAVYAAQRERSIGLGVMGWHSFLQKNKVPMESATAKAWNMKIFQSLHEQGVRTSHKLAIEKGACPDAEECGHELRFSNIFAIAPTASISIICGGTSPGIEPRVANAYTHKTLAGSFAVKNPYLEELLEEKGQNTEEMWTNIFAHEGSVQHLNFLTPYEKAVFKTAFEMDQRWLVDHAADRQPFICQSQSLNIFLPHDVHKRDLHAVHMRAWEKGVKSLYYLRSKSAQRAESAFSSESASLIDEKDECLSCQ